MTIIIPVILNEYNGNVLLFIDDIEYMQECGGSTNIIMKSNIEFETPLSLAQIQRKIETASIKMFKFN
jgi:hypothetical protein